MDWGKSVGPYALQRGGSLQFLFRFCLAPVRLGPSNSDSLVVSSPAIIVLETLNFEGFSLGLKGSCDLYATSYQTAASKEKEAWFPSRISDFFMNCFWTLDRHA